MVSRSKKSVAIYGLLLLSSVLTGEAQVLGHTQSFSHTQGFKNTQGFANPSGFANTQGFASTQFGNAPFYPNSYAAPYPLPHAKSAFHAGKGYTSPMNTGNLFYNYAHPVNAQYWTGHSLPGGYQQYPNQWGYQANGYMPYGHGYSGYQSWNYPQQYGSWGVHPGYSGQYVHYPKFNANYWMGHHRPMYAPVYPHHVPYYGHAQYPYYHQPYYYGRPRSFLGDLGRSKMAKGLLGALLVGVVAGKVARGK